MSRATILVVCLVGLVAPTAASPQQIPSRPEALTYAPIMYQPPQAKDLKVLLQNGIPAYLVPDNATALVRVSLLIRGGSYMEPADKPGVGQALGNLWRAGGTVTTTAHDLEERLAHLAATVATSVTGTQASIRLQVLDKDLTEGLRLMREVLLEPAFEQERLDVMKKAMIQQIESRNDSVAGIAGYQLPLLLFGENHFVGRQVTTSAIEAITRDDLKALHARLLHPKNMVLAVSGRFDRAAMVKTLNQVFGTLAASSGAEVAPPVPASDFVRKPGIYVSHKDVPQSMVIMALPGLRRSDPDWFPCLVANEILGGSTQAARLMRKLRSDEGLTYGVYSQFGAGPFYRGDWTVQLQTKNRSVAYAIGLILAEIDRMKIEPVSDEDLKVVKGILVDAFPNQFESPQNVANTFASEASVGWPEGYMDTFRDKVRAVTKADIQRVARKYFDTSQFVVLVVGNGQDAQAGDEKRHPGRLDAILPLPVIALPLK